MAGRLPCGDNVVLAQMANIFRHISLGLRRAMDETFLAAIGVVCSEL